MNSKKLIKLLLLGGVISVTGLAGATVNSYAESQINLEAESLGEENAVDLSWNAPDEDNKYGYTLFCRNVDEGESEFQSIPSKDTVRVLNIYPKEGNNCKEWMEANGYGKGDITVDEVTLYGFNNNPEGCLKDENGQWKYDVVYEGAWDSNNSRDFTQASVDVLKNFIKSGRGYLAGHGAVSPDMQYGAQLAKYVNVDLFKSDSLKAESEKRFDTAVLKKRGLINYPWNVGAVGDEISIPKAHDSYQGAKGRIWVKFKDSDTTSMNKDTNFYLTTWNNGGMIQTGHSNGQESENEEKLLANTLFYLSQVTDKTSKVDHMAEDFKAPDIPEVDEASVVSSDKNKLNIKLKETEDNGSQYEYYVKARNQADNSSIDSDKKIVESVSGFKGYSYVIDNNPETEVDDTIETSDLTLAEDITALDKTQPIYVHIKAIDNVGNASETEHYKYDYSVIDDGKDDGDNKGDGDDNKGQDDDKHTSSHHSSKGESAEDKRQDDVNKALGDVIDNIKKVELDYNLIDNQKHLTATATAIKENKDKDYTGFFIQCSRPVTDDTLTLPVYELKYDHSKAGYVYSYDKDTRKFTLIKANVSPDSDGNIVFDTHNKQFFLLSTEKIRDDMTEEMPLTAKEKLKQLWDDLDYKDVKYDLVDNNEKTTVTTTVMKDKKETGENYIGILIHADKKLVDDELSVDDSSLLYDRSKKAYIYMYNPETEEFKLIKENVAADSDGNITFNTYHGQDYLLTTQKLDGKSESKGGPISKADLKEMFGDVDLIDVPYKYKCDDGKEIEVQGTAIHEKTEKNGNYIGVLLHAEETISDKTVEVDGKSIVYDKDKKGYVYLYNKETGKFRLIKDNVEPNANGDIEFNNNNGQDFLLTTKKLADKYLDTNSAAASVSKDDLAEMFGDVELKDLVYMDTDAGKHISIAATAIKDKSEKEDVYLGILFHNDEPRKDSIIGAKDSDLRYDRSKKAYVYLYNKETGKFKLIKMNAKPNANGDIEFNSYNGQDFLLTTKKLDNKYLDADSIIPTAKDNLADLFKDCELKDVKLKLTDNNKEQEITATAIKDKNETGDNYKGILLQCNDYFVDDTVKIPADSLLYDKTKALCAYVYDDETGKYKLIKSNITQDAEGNITFDSEHGKDFLLTVEPLNESALASGWAKLPSNEWVFYNKETGKREIGWHKAATGEWTHNGKDTEGEWFHLGENTIMDKGWFQDTDKEWYYLADGEINGGYGAALRGWRYEFGHWYHLNKDTTKMDKGWNKIDGTWYYFYENGALATDTIIDGYTVDNSGAWVK